MDGQAILTETLRQHFQNPAGVLLTGEAHDEVVRVADQEGTSTQARLHVPLEPHVQHVVQIDVGQQRRNHSALRGAFLRVGNLPVLQHARVQPLADQSQQHAVSHPLR